ncbi:MAG: dTMP kinase [bacterium]|nr:dTMP kinase [bacterium]
MKGLFITIEGVEGSGKSTQIIRLKHDLESEGHTVDVTREPGGTGISESIRRLLLDPALTGISPVAELLLYQAARAQHVDERIRPALEAGHVVICDRFADSTTAYQGAGRDLKMDMILELHHLATRGVWPDLTIVLDLPVEKGLSRAAQVHEPDRLENEPIDFHQRVREEFLRLADREPDRVKIVDAALPVNEVSRSIWGHVEGILQTP